jgi:hypothetical protein
VKLVFKRNRRGFVYAEFKDTCGAKCSIQESSSAESPKIWLGVDDPEPKILAVDAAVQGLPTHGETTGWVPHKIPGWVLLTTRMHLDRTGAKALIAVLEKFVKQGSLEKRR